MKTLLTCVALAGLGGATAVEASDYYYRQHSPYTARYPVARPYPSCRVPTYYPPARNHIRDFPRHSYVHPRSAYSLYAPSPYRALPYPGSRAHFGVQGRNFSLHFGY